MSSCIKRPAAASDDDMHSVAQASANCVQGTSTSSSSCSFPRALLAKNSAIMDLDTGDVKASGTTECTVEVRSLPEVSTEDAAGELRQEHVLKECSELLTWKETMRRKTSCSI